MDHPLVAGVVAMTGWTTHYFRFRESQDLAWEEAMEAFPAEIASQIACDFGRCWIVDLPVVAAVLVSLALGDFGVRSLGEGRLYLPDEVRPAVMNLLRGGTRVRGRWWSVRRAHFASRRARITFQTLL